MRSDPGGPGELGCYDHRRKVARADEWDGLESRCGACVTMGSNPIPSATQTLSTFEARLDCAVARLAPWPLWRLGHHGFESHTFRHSNPLHFRGTPRLRRCTAGAVAAVAIGSPWVRIPYLPPLKPSPLSRHASTAPLHGWRRGRCGDWVTMGSNPIPSATQTLSTFEARLDSPA